MKHLLNIVFILSALVFFTCSEDDDLSDLYTGREITYDLTQSSQHPVRGRATFKEYRDGTTEVSIELRGTEGNIEHPAHLHYGPVLPDAEMAALLNPVHGNTGQSITHLTSLADETTVTYQNLLDFEGHIKIHLDGGPNKHVVLASGNIGSAAD